jgi:hypothetical protein
MGDRAQVSNRLASRQLVQLTSDTQMTKLASATDCHSELLNEGTLMDAAADIQQEATEIMVFDALVTARHCSGSDTCQGGQSEPRVCQSFMEPKPSTKPRRTAFP